MEKETLTAAGHSSLTVYHFGAHVTSWKNSSGKEILYTSPTAILDGSKAIRGGIPVCFPQFGKKGPLRQHGFARTSIWKHDKSFVTATKTSAIRFVLNDTAETRSSAWPHSFEAAIVISLGSDGNSMTVEMDVTNNNASKAFSFTTAFHSYFSCKSLDTVLKEFSGRIYEDTADAVEPGKKKEQIGDIHFGTEVDRVYLDVEDSISIPSSPLTIEKQNMPDAVVWNPYIEKTAALSDMPDDGWKDFICIEPGRIATPATVLPGKTWCCKFVIRSRA